MTEPNDHDLLLLPEIAALLRRSTYTLSKWRLDNKHPGLGLFRCAGRVVATRGDVARFIETQRGRDLQVGAGRSVAVGNEAAATRDVRELAPNVDKVGS